MREHTEVKRKSLIIKEKNKIDKKTNNPYATIKAIFMKLRPDINHLKQLTFDRRLPQ